MLDGWICLHRELLEKPIWKCSTPKQRSILITLLLMAGHKENEWEWKGEKFKVNPGEFVTSLKSISKLSGPNISIRNIRTALKRFENFQFLTNKTTNQGRLISIVNWDAYQVVERKSDKQSDKQVTSNRQAGDNYQQCNNETSKGNSVKENFYITKKKKKLSGKRLKTFELFWVAFDYKKGRSAAADSWLDIPQLTDGLVETIVKAAKLATRERIKIIDSGGIPKMAQGWLSEKRWEDEPYKKPEPETEVV